MSFVTEATHHFDPKAAIDGPEGRPRESAEAPQRRVMIVDQPAASSKRKGKGSHKGSGKKAHKPRFQGGKGDSWWLKRSDKRKAQQAA